MSKPPPSTNGLPAPAQPVEAVSDIWGDTAVARTRASVRGWLDAPMVLREFFHPRVSGNPDDDWLMGLVKRLGIPGTGHWLSLGCGSAGTEIEAARKGMFASMQAFDVAGRAIEEARRCAAAQGIDKIEFGVADVNRIALPPATFDVVLMCMSLHHVAELEWVLRSIRTALKPGGYFLINEFVGPRQFQFSDLQVEIVRDLLAVIPERLRIDATTGELKSDYRRQPVEHWNRWDPSESVRSDEIVPLLCRYFDVVLKLDYGGPVLHLLLEHIIHNFDYGKPEDVDLFRLLARTEELLIRHGVLVDEFTVMAMRKHTWRSRLQRGLPRSGRSSSPWPRRAATMRGRSSTSGRSRLRRLFVS